MYFTVHYNTRIRQQQAHVSQHVIRIIYTHFSEHQAQVGAHKMKRILNLQYTPYIITTYFIMLHDTVSTHGTVSKYEQGNPKTRNPDSR
jgi:hypothetical protein